MAHILIITHTHDHYAARSYLIAQLSGLWAQAGHRISVVAGLQAWPDADAALMHVDLSVVPQDYTIAAKRYPVVINGKALDIRKRMVSRHLLGNGDNWAGPVIIKTDLNNNGLAEWRLENIAQRGALTGISMRRYPVLRSIRDVPEGVWHDPRVVVERFLPERDERGFWIRTWTFLGDGERCTRYLGIYPVIKSGDIIGQEPVPVPDELRAERGRLGFDYGKFDFVMHEGKAVLFDANRTPGGLPHELAQAMASSNARLAAGLGTLLKGA